jgi:hypothetical protein
MASQKIGGYAYLLGIVIAVLAGIVGALAPTAIGAGTAGIILLVLVVLGLIIGYLNINDKRISDFLIATIAIAMIGGTAGGLAVLDTWVAPLGTLCVLVVRNILAVAAAAALVVGMKQIMALAKE